MRPASARRLVHIEILVLAAFLLALFLGMLHGCQVAQRQWDRTRAPLAGTSVAVAFGALGVAITGPIGLAVAASGVLGGTLVARTLEPAPEEHERKTTTVVQVPPPLPDGTPQKPRVDTYTTLDDGAQHHDGARGDLKLPAPDAALRGAVGQLELTAWEKFKRALWAVAWAVVGVALAVALVTHPRSRAALWGLLCFALGFVGRGLAKLWALARASRRPRPPAPPGA
jgi:hypothetical protein